MSALLLIERPTGTLAAEVLEAAAVWVDHEGFVQFTNERDGLLCTQGAVTALAMRLIPNWSQCMPVLELAVSATSEYVGMTLVTWNDTPGRTKDEVVSALRGAAEELRAA